MLARPEMEEPDPREKLLEAQRRYINILNQKIRILEDMLQMYAHFLHRNFWKQ